ncbi:MAG: hypothetical protein V3U53_09770 [bacterium]
MEVPVYLLDESDTYIDFARVMRGILGVEELRDPLTGRRSQPVGDDNVADEFVNYFSSL